MLGCAKEAEAEGATTALIWLPRRDDGAEDWPPRGARVSCLSRSSGHRSASASPPSSSSSSSWIGGGAADADGDGVAIVVAAAGGLDGGEEAPVVAGINGK